MPLTLINLCCPVSLRWFTDRGGCGKNVLLYPVSDRDDTILVDGTLVSSMQIPLLVERLLTRFLIVEVSHDNLRTLRQNLPRLANTGFRPVFLHNLHGSAGTDRTDGMRVLVIVQPGRMSGDAGARLRHPVALLETRLRELLGQELDDLLAEGRGTRGEAAQMTEVVVVHDRIPDHPDQNRRYE